MKTTPLSANEMIEVAARWTKHDQDRAAQAEREANERLNQV